MGAGAAHFVSVLRCALQHSGYTGRMTVLVRDVAGPKLAASGSVVCVGAFDGVHRGHQALLGRVRERARALGICAAAITFEPIPRAYFSPGGVPRLSSVREKIELIAGCGMDILLMQRFNARTVAMTAQQFIEQVLVARLGTREIWVGEDFRFGHGREGDLPMLREHGGRHGFEVCVMARIDSAGERISSSQIRQLLGAGDLAGAQQLLGRPFSVSGRVGHGAKLGRELGYPTANISLPRRTPPLTGVFAVWVHGLHDEPLPAVASLGTRPMVAGEEMLLEVHLLDFGGDLYGRRLDVEFVRKLRDEQVFADMPAMVRQIGQDAAQARDLLARDAQDTAGASA